MKEKNLLSRESSKIMIVDDEEKLLLAIKEYLITQLKKFSGNISKTARFVGMERSALHRKLKLLGVKDLNQ